MSKSTLGNLRIAMLDDDPLYREITRALLHSDPEMNLSAVATYDDLIKLLSTETMDCVLLDYDLGDDNGLNVIQKLADHFAELPPVVMLTGDGREKTVIKALRLGVSDYIPKAGLTADDLTSIIQKSVRKRRKELQRTADHSRLQAASGSDSLTGILNHEKLNERLHQLSLLALSTRRAYALVLIEIEGFSEIVGKFGFKASDKVVTTFVTLLKPLVRTSDVLGRYSDREFLIIANVSGDENQLNALCIRIAQHMHLKIDMDVVSLTVSARVGASLCHAQPTSGFLAAADLLAPARKGLAAAKASNDAYRIDHAPMVPISANELLAALVPAADMTRFADRRREPRTRVYKKGQIIIDHLNATIDCVVRDMSKHGARLRVSSTFAIPEHFDLVIVGDHKRRPVVLRWQKGGDFGVEYIDI